MAARSRVEDLAQGVLDVLPVTDTIYHHLAFTRPLVDSILRAVRVATPAGRVLVIAPNELLPAVLVELGYQVDLWVVDGLPLSKENLQLASRRGQLDEVLLEPPTQLVDVVILAYGAEAAILEPAELLHRLRRHVREGGYVVLACRQPGDIRRRLRAVLRKLRANVRQDYAYPPSPTWPALQSRRLLTSRDLVRAVGGHFRVMGSRYVIDRRAHLTTEALGLGPWLLKQGLHLAKLAVPPLRDCVLVTMVADARARPPSSRSLAGQSETLDVSAEPLLDEVV